MLPTDPPSDLPVPSRRRSRALVTVGSVLTVGLLGLGAAAITLGGGGASTPEEAVRHLATAVDEQDVVAAVATMAPDEMRSFPDLVGRVQAKMTELDLAGRFERALEDEQRRYAGDSGSGSGSGSESGDDDTDDGTGGAGKGKDGAGPFDGVDLKVTGLELRTTPLSHDIAKVEVIGGKLSWDVADDAAVVDPSELLSPFGYFPRLSDLAFGSYDYDPYDPELACGYFDQEYADEMYADEMYADEMYADEMYTDDGPATREECEADLAEAREQAAHGSVDFGKLHDEADDDRPGVFAMTVQRDGGWYISPFFTAAEYFRLDQGGDSVADYDVDPGPAAASPSAAVAAMADAAETGDSATLANVLASELSVWRVYRNAFADGEDGRDPMFGDVRSFEVSDLTTHEDPIDDERVRVVVDTVRIAWVQDEIDWDHVPDEYYEDEDMTDDDLPRVEVGYTITVDGDCATHTTTGGEDDETICLSTESGGMVKALGVDRIAVVAVADRDGWAVSPIETLADYLRSFVDHLTGPLLDRMFGGRGPAAIDAPSTRLRLGDNDVPLNDAGMATVELTLDDGTFATMTTDDEDTTIETDTYETFLSPGTHGGVVTGPIGRESVTVTVTAAVAEPLTATGPDGGATPPITGQVRPGEVRVFSMSAADHGSLVVDSGEDVDVVHVDAEGDPMDGALDEAYGEYGLDEPDAEPLDPTSTVYVVLAPYGYADFGDEGDGEADPELLSFTLSFVPPGGGFAGLDPSATTIDAGAYESTSLGVVAGRRFSLTAAAEHDVTVELVCPSSQFDEPGAIAMSFPDEPVDGNGSGMSFTTPEEDEAAGMSFNDFVGGPVDEPEDPTADDFEYAGSDLSFDDAEGLQPLQVWKDTPTTIWLSPTTTEVCHVFASPMSYDEEPDYGDAWPVVLAITPA